ncbi:hypothetical protein [Mesorhizobium sp.]|uniref:hypothetical protein n=1 Tax=Mesorhizobium sp. TaxID=1871066 RepID=UPI000FE913E8|nr:hypothetical protein [Mesorhizobium sp.]RWC58916.1 MAG: hypothetical protein EOS56_18580 [Mesorhizobium sp.]RWC66528.1 MAG: hypothetical protein EOS29_03935 [Mesorhizobium sp.]
MAKISQPARRSGKTAKAELISAAQAKVDQAKAAVAAADAKLVAAAGAEDQQGKESALAERTAADADVVRYQEALDLLTNSKGVTASAASPTTAAPTNAAVASPGTAVVEPVPGAPSSTVATGTLSTNAPPKKRDQGGAGNAAGSAGSSQAFVALTPILHSGREVAIGEPVELTKAEYDQLKPAQAIEGEWKD